MAALGIHGVVLDGDGKGGARSNCSSSLDRWRGKGSASDDARSGGAACETGQRRSAAVHGGATRSGYSESVRLGSQGRRDGRDVFLQIRAGYLRELRL
ncbi:hypothetical protein M0R45_019156 [Rubus argutus]|uniref:Uncharacterized protein n=1 Tax=Rubus argutus TaxID=59490 RepID=A0AAW1X5F9_RUBAR